MSQRLTAWSAYGYAHLSGAKAADYEALAPFVAAPRTVQTLSPSARELVSRDIDTIRSSALSLRLHDRVLTRRLSGCYRLAIDTYKSLGLKVRPLPLRIQERFPAPYDDDELWGLMLDRQDARDLSVPAGLYVRPSKAFPGVGEATVCHELVHTLFSFVESDALVRGYEEGVCDLISSIAMARVFGWDVAAQMLIGLRLFASDRRDMIYRDALRQVSAHLLLLGYVEWISFVKEVQRTGRTRFVEVESTLLEHGMASPPRKPKRQAENCVSELMQLAVRILSTPESYVMSPESYIIGERARVGESLSELRRKVRDLVPGTRFASALSELQSDLYLVVVDNKKIIANEAPRYISAGVCRYRL